MQLRVECGCVANILGLISGIKKKKKIKSFKMTCIRRTSNSLHLNVKLYDSIQKL